LFHHHPSYHSFLFFSFLVFLIFHIYPLISTGIEHQWQNLLHLQHIQNKSISFKSTQIESHQKVDLFQTTHWSFCLFLTNTINCSYFLNLFSSFLKSHQNKQTVTLIHFLTEFKRIRLFLIWSWNHISADSPADIRTASVLTNSCSITYLGKTLSRDKEEIYIQKWKFSTKRIKMAKTPFSNCFRFSFRYFPLEMWENVSDKIWSYHVWSFQNIRKMPLHSFKRQFFSDSMIMFVHLNGEWDMIMIMMRTTNRHQENNREMPTTCKFGKKVDH
jgi:hypothetical protein